MELTYKTQNSSSSEILYSAQTIADAFAEALKQNNCLLMLTVSLHQELNDAIKDVVDVGSLDQTGNNLIDDSTTDETTSLLDSIASAVKSSKSRCYSCSLSFPTISFNADLDAVLSKLQAMLNLYASLFKISGLDLCQPGYALRESCLPDILKLIVLLITAYVAFMTLKSIQSISVLAFIKGVINGLLSQLFSALKLSISIGGLNTSCIVEALREISETLVPDENTIYNSLDAQTRSAISQTKENSKTTNEVLDDEQKDVLNTAIKNDYTSAVSDAVNRVDSTFAKVDNTLKNLEKNINDTFKVVVDTMDEATNEINSYIKNLLALKLTFECEGKRSGTDVTEVIQKVNKLIQVINMLSSVAVSIAKKEALERICATDSTIASLVGDTITEDTQLKDLVEEYYQKETELVGNEESGVQVIIHEEPKESLLPKISLLDCSIDDFINSHKIENVIQVAEEAVRKELNDKLNNPSAPPYIGEGIYIIKKPTPDKLTLMDNIVNILYEDPYTDVDADNGVNNTDDPESRNELPEIINMIGTTGVSDMFKELNTKSQSTLNCRSINDVLSVLDQLRTKN